MLAKWNLQNLNNAMGLSVLEDVAPMLDGIVALMACTALPQLLTAHLLPRRPFWPRWLPTSSVMELNAPLAAALLKAGSAALMAFHAPVAAVDFSIGFEWAQQKFVNQKVLKWYNFVLNRFLLNARIFKSIEFLCDIKSKIGESHLLKNYTLNHKSFHTKRFGILSFQKK